MTIKDFTIEEQELIRTGAGRSLQEFRRQLVFSMQSTIDSDLREFIRAVFDKFRLVTEREWEDMQRLLPTIVNKLD